MMKLIALSVVMAVVIQIFRMKKTFPLIWLIFFIALNAAIHSKTFILEAKDYICLYVKRVGFMNAHAAA